MLGNAAISWSSKKQTLVALSTKEAEYTAFTEASREALWLRQLLLDIDNRGGSQIKRKMPPSYTPTTREQLSTPAQKE